MEKYSIQDMIDFADWFQTRYGDMNTNPTKEDVEKWEIEKEWDS